VQHPHRKCHLSGELGRKHRKFAAVAFRAGWPVGTSFTGITFLNRSPLKRGNASFDRLDDLAHEWDKAIGQGGNLSAIHQACSMIESVTREAPPIQRAVGTAIDGECR
jgi:hypothetical protein